MPLPLMPPKSTVPMSEIRARTRADGMGWEWDAPYLHMDRSLAANIVTAKGNAIANSRAEKIGVKPAAVAVANILDGGRKESVCR